MRPIIYIKDGLFVNLAVIIFLLGLAMGCVWLDHRSHGDVSIIVWGFAGAFALSCWIPINNMRKPKFRMLVIEGDDLVWRVRDEETKSLREERIPLRQIRALEFVIPREVSSKSSLPTCAELYFVSRQGGKRALPLDLFPGVYRSKIVAAIRERVPNVEVQEVDGGAD